MTRFFAKGLLFVWFFVEQTRISRTVDCFVAEECAFGSSSNDPLNCYGYRSCAQMKSLNGYNDNFYCYGSYSCYKIESVETTASGTGYFTCYGLFSCASCPYVDFGDTVLHCYGEKSCFDSSIISSSDQAIYCDGGESCGSSTISATDYVYFDGFLSANKAMLDGGGYPYYYFRGAFAGYNATVTCNSGDICYIYCYGNGCFNLNLVSNGGEFRIDCTYAVIDYNNITDNVCLYNNDTGIDSDTYIYTTYNHYNIPSLVDVEMSTLDNSFEPCVSTATNATHCIDYQECMIMNTSYTTISNNGPVCCSGSESCNGATDIEGDLPENPIDSGYQYFDGDYYSRNISVRCDGYQSCASVSNHILAKSDSDMYFTGYQAAAYTTIEMAQNSQHSIYCSGYSSCSNTQIKYGLNLYCTGSYSCAYFSYIEDITNVYGYGTIALIHSTLVNIDYLYCGSGYRSCANMSATNVNYIYCGPGYYACALVTASNVDGIYGVGYSALFESDIYNVSQIACIGIKSCARSKIRSIHEALEARGEDALSRSVIISESVGTLNVYISGTNDGLFEFYCNDTDICKIYCQSPRACSNMVLHCPGSCVIECDEYESIDCPVWVNGEIIMVSEIPTATTSSTTALTTSSSPKDETTTIATTSDHESNQTAIRTQLNIEQTSIIETESGDKTPAKMSDTSIAIVLSVCLFCFMLCCVGSECKNCLNNRKERRELDLQLSQQRRVQLEPQQRLQQQLYDSHGAPEQELQNDDTAL